MEIWNDLTQVSISGFSLIYYDLVAAKMSIFLENAPPDQVWITYQLILRNAFL